MWAQVGKQMTSVWYIYTYFILLFFIRSNFYFSIDCCLYITHERHLC